MELYCELAANLLTNISDAVLDCMHVLCLHKLSSPVPKPLVQKPPRPNPNKVPIRSKTLLYFTKLCGSLKVCQGVELWAKSPTPSSGSS